MAMMPCPASVSRPIAPTAPSRRSPYSRIFELPQRLLQLIFVRKLVMPCRDVFHERHAAAFNRVGNEDLWLSVLRVEPFYQFPNLIHFVAIDVVNFKTESLELVVERFEIHDVVREIGELKAVAIDDHD